MNILVDAMQYDIGGIIVTTALARGLDATIISHIQDNADCIYPHIQRYLLLMLSRIADVVDINAHNIDWYRAIQVAARNNWGDVVDGLIAAGADLNVQSRDVPPAICLAAEVGATAIVSALLDAGVDIESVHDTGDLDTPLLLAMHGGHYALVKALLLRGADASAVNRWSQGLVDVAPASCPYDIRVLVSSPRVDMRLYYIVRRYIATNMWYDPDQYTGVLPQELIDDIDRYPPQPITVEYRQLVNTVLPV